MFPLAHVAVHKIPKKLTPTPAHLEHAEVHTKVLCLEAATASSVPGSTLRSITSIRLYFVTQALEEASLDWSLIKSVFNSIYWLLCLPANHSTKTQSTGTYQRMQ